MSIRHRLATNAGIPGDGPNQELAQEIAKSQKPHHVRELLQILTTGVKSEKHDAIKTLYELGKLEPKLICGYAKVFLDLLHSADNRLVWGAMTALRTISTIQHDELWDKRKLIIKELDNISVITRDEAVKVLANVASKRAVYAEELVPELLDHLMNDRPKDVAKNAENTLVAISEHYRAEFVKVLKFRKTGLSHPAQQRVEKLIKTLQ